MIIGLNGYSGSGKDAVGTIIQYLNSKYKPSTIEDCIKNDQDFSTYTDWQIKKWAGKLKTIASILTGIPVEKFEDQEFKKTHLGPEWSTLKMKPGKRQDGIFPKKIDMELVPMTVRDFLQKLGTDGLRDGLHTNTWVNALMADYKPSQYINSSGFFVDGIMPNWIITDTRFPNEAEAIKSKGGIIIRINRPGVAPINAHPSETSLDDWKFDHVIDNNGDIDQLVYKVNKILIKDNIPI